VSAAAASPPPFFSLEPDTAEGRVVELGGKAFHARIVRREALERGVLDYSLMSGLSRPLRAALERELPLVSAREVARETAADGAVKLLLELPDGECVESVHIPSHRPGAGATACVSSQVGCPVGCPFCASGLSGLRRNLEAHEIIEQLLLLRDLGPLSRIVVMGIGEPLLNATSLVRALDVAREGLGIGARRITVSTVGFPERVASLAEADPHFQLAISLHSADDAERARLVPAMAEVSVEEVLGAGDLWFAKTGREPTYEVVLLGGTNDSPDHASRMARRLAGRRATVNLIPFNPVPGLPYERPETGAVARFKSVLEEAGLVATVRWSRGARANAACGQLRLR